MERKDFLKGLGIIGVGSMLPFGRTKAAILKSPMQSGSCVLIPQETAGPYPWNMNTNALFFRQDIREGNAGTQLNLALTVVNVNDNCNPVPNARVDIWHCDKDGNYSEYNNFTGQTFFRGYQITDVNGTVNFTTIYPGWYSGRVTHIHFQVFLNSVLRATSQLAFPDLLNTAVNNSSLYAAHGTNPTVNSNDNVFIDTINTQYELLNPSLNTAGEYDASLEFGVAVPVTGVINLEPETGGQFKLSMNYPNPFSEFTNIPFRLTHASNVMIEIYDMTGKKVFDLAHQHMDAGEQNVMLNRQSKKHALTEGNYVYQLTVENDQGTFRQCKVMTIK